VISIWAGDEDEMWKGLEARYGRTPMSKEEFIRSQPMSVAATRVKDEHVADTEYWIQDLLFDASSPGEVAIVEESPEGNKENVKVRWISREQQNKCRIKGDVSELPIIVGVNWTGVNDKSTKSGKNADSRSISFVTDAGTVKLEETENAWDSMWGRTNASFEVWSSDHKYFTLRDICLIFTERTRKKYPHY